MTTVRRYRRMPLEIRTRSVVRSDRPRSSLVSPGGSPGLMRIAAFHNLGSGGAKRAIHGLLKYLAERGHVVEVFVPSTANEEYLPLRAVTHGVRVFPVRTTFRGIVSSSTKYVPPPALGCSLADLETSHKAIARVINERDYAAVFVEQDRYMMSPFLLKYLRRPSVYYCPQPYRGGEAILRSLQHALAPRGWIRRLGRIAPVVDRVRSLGREWALRQMGRDPASVISRIDRDNASAASVILTNSFYSKESILRAYGLISFVSYLGVDTTVFRPLPEAKGDYLLTVGSCTPEKGLDFLIRVLGKIEHPLCPRLVIVSNTVHQGWKLCLEQLAARADVTVEFKAMVSDEELVGLYNSAIGFLYAPYLEPFGLAPVEAMACGAAVVAVKEGGVRESVLHNQTGTLVERDEDAFAEAVRELLLDKVKRDRLGGEGVEWVRGFWTTQHAGQRLLSNLGRVTNGGRAVTAEASRIGRES